MYCEQCGSLIEASSAFCSVCGRKVSVSENVLPKHAKLQPGYTNRINDPAFAKYLKQSNKWASLFSFILAVIAFVGFSIAGALGLDGLENPQAMYIGLGIGGMFILIALFQIIGKKRSKTWDGLVINKTHKLKREKVGSGDDTYWKQVMVYKIHLKEASGKKHIIKHRDNQTVYDYFHKGDAVRHHGGLNSYEKYDKSNDSIIFCLACGHLHTIDEDICSQCKCPLPK